MRHALFVMILSADGARVKHLTQAVCNQIAGDHEQHQDQLAGMQQEVFKTIGIQTAERAASEREAETDKAQKGLEENRARNRYHDLGDQRTRDIRQDLLKQNEGVSRTERARSLRKFLILQAQHLRAGDNAHLHPAGQHERKDDRPGLDDLPGVHDVHIVGHAEDHAEVMRDADGKLP